MSIRIGAYILIALLSLSAGWFIRGWKEDSETLAVERAVKTVQDAVVKHESGIAEKVEERLSELNANQTVIDRGIIREIQNPVYRNVCIGVDGVRLLNSAARGDAPGDTAEPAEEVPRAASAAD